MTRKGQFPKGISGNPTGRPKGSKDRRTAILRDLLEPHADALIKKAVALGKAGDVQALRLCLERLLPPLKAEITPVFVPALDSASGLANQGRVVLGAVASGALAPDSAVTLMQILTAQARIIEVDELERRIAAMESNRSKS